MPACATVYRWLSGTGEARRAFRDQYARAREAQADREFDEIRELADGSHESALAASAEVVQGGSVVARKLARQRYYEELQARKLMIDARKFRVARMAPKKYSERASLTMEVSSPPERPIRVAHATDDATLASVLSMLEDADALPETNGAPREEDIRSALEAGSGNGNGAAK